MIRFTNSLKKVKVAALGVASSLVIASCGSYQPVSYDNDGIYGTNGQNQQRVAAPVNANTAAPVANSNSYFTQKLNEYENAASGDDVLTDVENYSSQYYDESQVNNDSAYYPGWGQDTQQATVQVYANTGWGYNNYNPFWNRGYRNGWNNPYAYGGFYGSGFYGNGFYGGGFYGGGFYGGGFYAGGFYGNNFWFGNGFYNNRFNNRYYGNRRYANNRRNVGTAARRNYTPRYSGNRNSARSSSARSSARTYSPRQSSSNSSARSSNSSNRNYSPRSSSSSSSSNRSYSPRSSSSSNNRSSSSARSSRSSSSSARSSRSSSSRSSSGGTYRRR